MKKEILTTENIKKDLSRHFFNRIKKFPIALTVCIAVTYAGSSFHQGRSFENKLVIVLLAISLIMISYALVTIIIGLIQTKKGKFTITTDWVVDKAGVVGGSSARGTITYRLIFAKSGACDIPFGINYQWSKMFATSAETLYEHTEINEEFYVIHLGKKNVMAYRKKHFELENLQVSQ